VALVKIENDIVWMESSVVVDRRPRWYESRTSLGEHAWCVLDPELCAPS